MKILAFDLETELIADRTRTARVNTSPYVIPRPVCGTAAWTHPWPGSDFMSPEDTVLHLMGSDADVIVGHNVAFDIGVLSEHCAMRGWWIEQVEAGRVFDTMILDWLARLAEGVFDMPRYDAESGKWSVPEPRVRSLGPSGASPGLAKIYAGLELDKDPTIRLGFGPYLDRFDEIPEKHRLYAIEDAVATLRVFEKLYEITDRLSNGDGTFLSHHIQLQAIMVAQDMDRRGVAIDRSEAARLRAHFAADELPLQRSLVNLGLGRWEPLPVAEAPRRHEDMPLEIPDIPDWTEFAPCE